MMACFVYISLHYAYAELSNISLNDFYTYHVLLHSKTLMGAKLIGVLFFLFIFIIFTGRFKNCLKLAMGSIVNKWMGAFVLIWLVIILGTISKKLIYNIGLTNLVIQDGISSILMFVLIFGFSAAIRYSKTASSYNMEKYGKFIFILLTVAVITSLYQILSIRHYAGTTNMEGEIIPRASSLLFNPNLFGIWCAFLIIMGAYIYHAKILSRPLSISMLMMASLGILLSGSRSALIICLSILSLSLIIIILMPILFKKEKILSPVENLMPLFIVLGTVDIAGLIAKYLSYLTGNINKGLYGIMLLAERLIVAPLELFAYTYNMLHGGSEVSKSLSVNYRNLYLTYDTATSIHGRLNFSGTGRPDNGYWIMYNDFGSLALIFWMFIWLAFIIIGVLSLHKNQSINSAYSLSAIVGCCVSGLFVSSFQTFPFWVLISLACSICLVWFSRVLEKENI